MLCSSKDHFEPDRHILSDSLISLVEVTEVVKLLLYHMVPGVKKIHPKIAECFVQCWATLVDTS